MEISEEKRFSDNIIMFSIRILPQMCAFSLFQRLYSSLISKDYNSLPPTSPNIQITGMNTNTSTRPTSLPTILERKISEAAIFKRTRTRGSRGGRTQTTLLGNSHCSSSSSSSSSSSTSSSSSLLSQK